jgi:RHS repeat-associated protein
MLWQQVNGLGTKKLKYEYDLVSGKVNTVSYQPGVTNEEFYYRYLYDAENRIIEAQTSNTAYTALNLTTQLLNPVTDARYKYYPHGPLARIELGQDKVQGIDYAYTLQGWMKGINGNRISTGSTDGGDIGGDGRPGSSYVNNARDVFAFSIGYYHGDYKPVGASAQNPNPTPAFDLQFTNTTTGFGANLYNGNISHTTIALSQFNSGNPVGYTYQYDQLNRIKAMQQHVLGGPGANSWSNGTGNTPQLYAETYSYDANGNILTLNRNGNKPASLAMDQLTYHYQPGTNKLGHVTDQVAPGAYTDAEVQDIETQAEGNYTYDAIGNMTSDAAEGIDQIQWTVYGKIRSIVKPKGNTITFIDYSYDAAGNRVHKKVRTLTFGSSGPPVETAVNTYYLRDAQGNVLALYEQPHGGSIAKTEQHLYGSSRLGMYRPVQTGITVARREYELSNHLGNVVAVISDRKIAVDVGNNGTIDYYEAEVLSQNDYYPFGMTMPGRKFNGGYRYGFNGKEEDDEVKGEGNQYDYGFRIYDPRLVRFLSVDPLFQSYPWYTPYQFAGNKPIMCIDLDGLEEKEVITYQWKNEEGQIQTLTMEFILEKSEQRAELGSKGTLYITYIHDGKGYVYGEQFVTDPPKPGFFARLFGGKRWLPQVMIFGKGNENYGGKADYSMPIHVINLEDPETKEILDLALITTKLKSPELTSELTDIEEKVLKDFPELLNEQGEYVLKNRYVNNGSEQLTPNSQHDISDMDNYWTLGNDFKTTFIRTDDNGQVKDTIRYPSINEIKKGLKQYAPDTIPNIYNTTPQKTNRNGSSN